MDSNVAPLLRELGHTPQHKEFAPYADLSKVASLDEYCQRFGRKTKRGRRRKRRALEEQGEVQFRVHHEGRSAQDLVSRAMAFKKRWLPLVGSFHMLTWIPGLARFGPV